VSKSWATGYERGISWATGGSVAEVGGGVKQEVVVGSKVRTNGTKEVVSNGSGGGAAKPSVSRSSEGGTITDATRRVHLLVDCLQLRLDKQKKKGEWVYL